MAADGTDHDADPTEGAANVLPFRPRRRVPPGAPGKAAGALPPGDSPATSADLPRFDQPQKRRLLRPGRPPAARTEDEGLDGDAHRRAGQHPVGSAPAPATPTSAQLLAWLEGLRRSGVPAVHWNVASISLERAIARAVCLTPAAQIAVDGYRVLVVEPLPARGPTAATAPDVPEHGLPESAQIVP